MSCQIFLRETNLLISIKEKPSNLIDSLVKLEIPYEFKVKRRII
jgi:hypothetical protein